MLRCMRLRNSLASSANFARFFLAMVLRLTQNAPWRVVLQIWVKPRKSNVSGLPSPRSAQFWAAKRPKLMRRVFFSLSTVIRKFGDVSFLDEQWTFLVRNIESHSWLNIARLKGAPSSAQAEGLGKRPRASTGLKGRSSKLMIRPRTPLQGA
jgi:hypothetical protein